MVTTKTAAIEKIPTDPLAVAVSLVVVLLGQFGLFTYLGLDGNEVAQIGATITGIAAAVRAWWLRRAKNAARSEKVSEQSLAMLVKTLETTLLTKQKQTVEDAPVPVKRRKSSGISRKIKTDPA